MTQKSTPVLFITFARPEYARQTFDAIKKAKPSKLYFYSNKARPDNPDELARNNQIRAYTDEIDWKCDLLTFFRDKHVDIYTSLWSAIDWVFDNEEQAIILEEDCVPSLAFFDFCEQLLPKYKEDLRVWVISGNNFIEGYNPSGYDYIFSRFYFMYGWASWRSRWEKIKRQDVPIKEIESYQVYKQTFITNYAANKRLKSAKKNHHRNAWDFLFNISVVCNGGMGIVPTKNLVSNIGAKGAHSSSANKLFHFRKVCNGESYRIEKPPSFYIPDFLYDQKFAKTLYRRNFLQKITRIINPIRFF